MAQGEQNGPSEGLVIVPYDQELFRLAPKFFVELLAVELYDSRRRRPTSYLAQAGNFKHWVSNWELFCASWGLTGADREEVLEAHPQWREKLHDALTVDRQKVLPRLNGELPPGYPPLQIYTNNQGLFVLHSRLASGEGIFPYSQKQLESATNNLGVNHDPKLVALVRHCLELIASQSGVADTLLVARLKPKQWQVFSLLVSRYKPVKLGNPDGWVSRQEIGELLVGRNMSASRISRVMQFRHELVAKGYWVVRGERGDREGGRVWYRLVSSEDMVRLEQAQSQGGFRVDGFNFPGF